MQKKMRFFLCKVIAITVLAVPAFAQQYNAEGDFEIEGYDGMVVITKYVGTSKTVSIPPRIQNKQVIGIAPEAFADKQLTRVIIPDGMGPIMYGAFAKNLLTSVTIPNSVNIIDDWAFVSNRLTSVTFGNDVREIGDGAFAMNQLTSVTIPNSVTKIGADAFRQNQLASVTIPDSVTEIGANAFRQNLLTSVSIPRGVIVGEGAFDSNVRITRR